MSDSIPARLMARGVSDGERPAVWSQVGEQWQALSWAGYAAKARAFAGAMIARGLGPGSTVAIMSENRVEWLIAAMGAMAAGGVPVGVYQTLPSDDAAYVISHCKARLVVAEDATQWAKIARAIDGAKLDAGVRGAVIDAAGVDDARAVSFEALLAEGAGHEAEVDARLAAIEPDALASLIYTSGTTGVPKGVMISHHNLVWTTNAAKGALGFDPGEDDAMVSYLPLSHIAEQMFSLYLQVTFGYPLYMCPQVDALRDVLTEARPTIFLGVPRVWEKFKAALEGRLAELDGPKALLVRWARKTLARTGRRAVAHGPPGGLDGLQVRLAEAVFAGPLKAKLGLDRLKVAATAAAPIGEDVLEFFLSVGVTLHDIYGQSEVTGPTSFNRPIPGQRRLGTVGLPLPGVRVRIADDGEICVQGGNVFAGYYKNPEATAEVLADGWLHSGDLGELDGDGFLRITGRKKDLIITAGGKNVGPGTIESELKAIDGVAHAVVVGDRRKYLAAVMTIEPETAAALARAKGWPTEVEALAEHPGFRAHVEAGVERVNAGQARYCQIKRFALLPVEFTVDGGELTPTQKVKRRVVDEKYRAVIDGLYPEA